MIPELHSNAPGRLQACVGQETDWNDLLLALPLELMVELRVREASGSPMLRRNDIARLHLEWSWKVPPQGSVGEISPTRPIRVSQGTGIVPVGNVLVSIRVRVQPLIARAEPQSAPRFTRLG
jgi:hypothetical protein